MSEEWRDIPGYEGLYQVSTEGRIKSLGNERSRKEKILKGLFCCSNRKYRAVRLFRFKKGKTEYVHRLVAITFPELVQNEYFDGAEIDHIDTDPMNNHPSNLRWVTTKENINNPLTREHMLNAQQKGGCTVQQISKKGELLAEYDSIREAERITGVKHQTISRVANNKPHSKTAGGFVWKIV